MGIQTGCSPHTKVCPLAFAFVHRFLDGLAALESRTAPNVDQEVCADPNEQGLWQLKLGGPFQVLDAKADGKEMCWIVPWRRQKSTMCCVRGATDGRVSPVRFTTVQLLGVAILHEGRRKKSSLVSLTSRT